MYRPRSPLLHLLESDIPSLTGRTVMHMACSAGQYKIVESLLKLGAQVNIKDRWEQTPLSLALKGKQHMIVTILASSTMKAKLDMADPELALCSAAGEGDFAQVKRLIDFGVAPNIGDYDHRTALHIAAAEGHEKVVEYLLFAHADPNCKDRWGGSPLQDALTGGHISTAQVLKSKGADVPESFGAGAVCEAAAKGDVPTLRMLHSFGQPLDVGDYDDRYAQHLASAEGRVLAVSFLLGISADPNKRDRWNGTPMDDCVRGNTLYHKYCAKLLQGWGGELGTFKGTKAGEMFLSDLAQISIKSVREVIRRLIDQGLDKECPERMDDQQMLVVMTATVRHMPLVTQLHINTAVITKEIKNFRNVVQTCAGQIRQTLTFVLANFTKGSQRVPVLDDLTFNVDKEAMFRMRPRTAKRDARQTREQLRHEVDLFAGIDQENNSQILDSLLLESPAHSHAAVCKPRRMVRWLKRHSKHLDQAGGLGTDTGASIESWKEPSYVRGLFLSADSDDTGTLTFNKFAEMDLHKGVNRVTLKRAFESVDLNRNGEIEMSEFMTYMNSGLHIQLIHNMEDISRTESQQEAIFRTGTTRSKPKLDKEFHPDGLQGSKGEDALLGVVNRLPKKSTANILKRNSKRSEALLKTLFDSTIPHSSIRECTRMLKKLDSKTLKSMPAAMDSVLDSDEENDLHDEIDCMTFFIENMESKANVDLWWERQAAKLFNQLALQIVEIERAVKLLHQIFCASLPAMQRPDADPILGLENLSRGLVTMQSNIEAVDLDECIAEVHACLKPFKLLMAPKERAASKDEATGQVRFSTLVAASSTFRRSILTMKIDNNLCHLMKSKVSEFFDESQARLLMENASFETLQEKAELFRSRGKDRADFKIVTIVLSGEVNVFRTLDDIEIGHGKCTVGCFFGGFKALEQRADRLHEEPELPVKEGGDGVNDCVIQAATECSVLRIRISILREALTLIDENKASFFINTMLEKISSDVLNLENLNALALEPVHTIGDIGYGTRTHTLDVEDHFHTMMEDWKIPMTKRRYYSSVPEIQKQMIHNSFLNIDALWRHISRGSKTVPKSTVDLIKESLGESGAQCYDQVFAPMEQPTAPAFFDAQSFWFCWVKFLLHSLKHDVDEHVADGKEEDEPETQDISTHNDNELASIKGVFNIKVKNAVSLMPMDTFTGKADPFIIVHCDHMTQQTQIKPNTLKPVWNESMQFNAAANTSMVKIEVFDNEALAAARSMGSVSFVVSPNPIKTSISLQLGGVIADGRSAQGTVNVETFFVRGGKARKTLEQRTEFQVFCDEKNTTQWILSLLLPSRSIETTFFQVPLSVHEREYVKAVGSLGAPLTGLAIKQYLTYVLIEHSHQIDLYSVREFCRFFKRELNVETSISYRDIVKVVKERNSDSNNLNLWIGSTLNPYHWLLRRWLLVVKLVSCYHMIMMPVRIGFRPWANFFDPELLVSDLPADMMIFLHVIVLLNQAYRNSKSQWVTNRFRIFKNMDWFVILAVLPIDWLVMLSGMSEQSAVFARMNKILLIFSSIKPLSLFLSARGNSISDLLLGLLIITHYATCVFYYLGEQILDWPDWKAPLKDLGIKVSWLQVKGLRENTNSTEAELVESLNDNMKIGTYSRGVYGFEQKFVQRYLLSFYWVICTYTTDGVTDLVFPQNPPEVVFTIAMMLIHLTIWQWISGEIANMVMSIDDAVIRAREAQEAIIKFVSVSVFTDDLRNRIQSHFSVVRGNVSEEQDAMLKALSHGLRVDLARFIWRDFLSKVYLFRGCSGQFVDAVSVVVTERHFGPEEMIKCAGDVSDSIVILVHGAIETYSSESSRTKKLSRKGSVVAALSALFGIRQYSNCRGARSGAVCACLSSEGMKEILQMYPKDEERVQNNALNFYSKDKPSEGTVAISNFSGAGSEDSSSSQDSKETSKSGGTHVSGASRVSAKTSGSQKTSNSKRSTGSRASSGMHRKRKNLDQDAPKQGKVEQDRLAHVDGVSEAGGASSIGAGETSKDDNGNIQPSVQLIEAQDTPLMHESEHVESIRQRLMEEKISRVLFASGRGDTQTLETLFKSDGIAVNCKDSMGRTPLHIAASEGHVKPTELLIELRADITAKDRYGNSPFNDAVRSKRDEVVKILRSHDPSIAFKLDGYEVGVLMCKAAFSGNLEDIQRLVSNGVDTNETDYDGRTALHLAASEGKMEVLKYLVDVKANIMCRDRFGCTPLEDAVRHHFDILHAEEAQKLLRDRGATLSGEGLKYVVKMCEYAAEGDVSRIRVLAQNGVDVSLGDYDDRTPLHLAACNGHTAVLEYLLQQKTVLVNAVDRFGGTPFVDSVRHDRKGAAALLEEAGCVRTTDSKSKEVINEMIERSNMKKEERQRAEREPKVRRIVENSQESKMVATISDKLSKTIALQSSQIELISKRLIWALRGFGQRLQRNACSIPFTDNAFTKATEHLIRLVIEMQESVNKSRSILTSEMNGDDAAADCLIWSNASKEYKREARELDHQMLELIILARVAKRILKEVTKVCRRGQRQALYADGNIRRSMT